MHRPRRYGGGACMVPDSRFASASSEEAEAKRVSGTTHMAVLLSYHTFIV